MVRKLLYHFPADGVSHQGFTLCGIPPEKRFTPTEHHWVCHASRKHIVNCEACILLELARRAEAVAL